jgi:hypothetical protein
MQGGIFFAGARRAGPWRAVFSTAGRRVGHAVLRIFAMFHVSMRKFPAVLV